MQFTAWLLKVKKKITFWDWVSELSELSGLREFVDLAEWPGLIFCTHMMAQNYL